MELTIKCSADPSGNTFSGHVCVILEDRIQGLDPRLVDALKVLRTQVSSILSTTEGATAKEIDFPYLKQSIYGSEYGLVGFKGIPYEELKTLKKAGISLHSEYDEHTPTECLARIDELVQQVQQLQRERTPSVSPTMC